MNTICRKLRRFINRLYNTTLTFKIVFIFILVSLISSTVISTIYYHKMAEFFQEKNRSLVQNICNSIINGIENQIEGMDRISKIILGNPEIQRILKESQESDYNEFNKIKDFATIRDLAISVMSVSDRIRVNIYHKDGNVYFSESNIYSYFHTNLFDDKWLAENKDKIDAREFFFIPPTKTDIRLMNKRKVFFVIRCLKSVEENNVVGYITISSDVNVLENIILSNLPKDLNIRMELIDQDGNLITDIGGKNIAETGEDKEKVTTIKQKSELCECTLIAYVPNSIISTSLIGIRKDTVIVWGVVIICSLILISFISAYTLKPLQYFVESMSAVEKGDFNIKLNYKGLTYEVRQLYKGFNRMVHEIKMLIKNLQEEKLLVKNAQIEALQFQINPHFLYNTFQTIESIGEVKNIPELQIIANSLGKLFRYNIQGNNIVTLRDEIQHIETYFLIQKVRFKDRLTYCFDIEDKAYDCKILKFILQPLVENCMKHGIDSIDSTGIISVKAGISEGCLNIAISDNGKGIASEKLQELNQKLEEVRLSGSNVTHNRYVGILNVQKRIVNYYGQNYGVKFADCKMGTTVVIKIPAIFDD